MKALLIDLLAALVIVALTFAILSLLALYLPTNQTPYFHGGKWNESPIESQP